MIDGIPPIPNEMIAKIAPYTEFRLQTVVAWHPSKPGILVRMRAGNTNQLHYVESPGAKAEQWTDFPDAVSSASFQPKKGEYIPFEKGAGGNEVFRIYRMDLATKGRDPLFHPMESAPISTAGIAPEIVSSTRPPASTRNSASREARMRLFMADPMKPEEAKLLSTFEAGGWGGFRYSRDGKTLVFGERISANEAHVDDECDDGRKEAHHACTQGRRSARLCFAGPLAKDDKSLYALSDRDNEFRQLVRIDLATAKNATGRALEV